MSSSLEQSLEVELKAYLVKKEVLNPKVSVIIPAYNTEKYISKCLISLIKQTLKDIEIIVINDGSTDKTFEIISKFALIDSRVKVLSQENKKQGVARNVGTSDALGEYIGYVDSDDWVDLDYFEKLYTSAKKYDADIAMATNIRIGNGKTKKRLHIESECFVEDLQSKVDVCKLMRNPCPTNKIYRAELLKNNNILWPEGIYCEDKLFTVKAVYYSNGIVTVPNVNYYYFRNPNSTVKNRFNQGAKFKNDARKSVLKFLRENDVKLKDETFFAVKKELKIFGLPLVLIKEYLYTEKWFLFGCLPIFKSKVAV